MSDTQQFTPEQVFEIAAAAHGAGDRIRAIELYDMLLAHFPAHAILLQRRGVAAREVGDKAGAAGFLVRAADAAPDDAETWSNLGNAQADLHDAGARASHLRAAALAPDHPGVLLNAAGYLIAHSEEAAGLPLVRRVLEISPNDAMGWGLLGDALKALNRNAEAIEAFGRALEFNPRDADRWFSFGFLLFHSGAFSRAAAAFRKVLDLRPDHPPALTNLGLALLDDPEALALHERALARDPDLPAAAMNRAFHLLAIREWDAGWVAWETRRRQATALRRDFAQPLWDGQALGDGDHLLIWSEQGYGDVIMMLRYLPAVRARVAAVTVEFHPGLAALAHDLPDGVARIERGQALPAFTHHLPIGSLPRVIGAFPATFPYLSPPPERVAAWARAPVGREPRVGLVWAGRPEHANDRLRSLNLADLAPLLRHSGVRFFSLQVGPAQAALALADLAIEDLADRLTDFAETAAALSQIDLLISVDTAILNLAGALNRPAWGVLAPNPDWRWGVKGETSDWYPSVRLFRRGVTPAGDAEPVETLIARLDAAFAVWLAAPRS